MADYCNSVNKAGTHSCELDKDHDGKCRQESFDGGYVFWPKPEGVTSVTPYGCP